jgi:predicted Zn-dependent protease
MTIIKIVLFCFLVSFTQCPSHAGLMEIKQGSVIADDETEAAFKGWIQKIFNVANLKQYHPRIFIIVNHEINAAASLGGPIYIFSEFLTACDNASQFLGVMAHEVGHIAGGHVSRIDAAQQQAMVPAAAAMILGGALALATGSGDALMAGLAGGSHIFERGMLKFSRSQECSADQAALTYLEKLGWPPEGLSSFLDKISKKQGSQIDPYSVTHPLTPDRVEAVHSHLRKTTHKTRSIPPEIEATFQRIKAKMMAFLEPDRALNVYKSSDASLPARYARSIALYRKGQFSQALSSLDALIKAHSRDPYFHELKGQILFENGDVEGPVVSLKTARSLKPSSQLISIMLAHALIERKSSPGSEEAIRLLCPITTHHPHDYPMAWRLLGMAYGKTGQLGQAALALAEEALLHEDFKLATSQANRAKNLLKDQPKALRRANDLMYEINQKMTR